MADIEVFIYTVEKKPNRRAEVVGLLEVTENELRQGGEDSLRIKVDAMVRKFYRDLEKYKARRP